MNLGTTDFTLDLLHDTEETGRQFPFYPKALHPQMESLISLRGSEVAVMSIALCNFGHLALMEDLPEDAENIDHVSRFAFRSSGVVNISETILVPVGRDLASAMLSPDAALQLQKFIAQYCRLVLHIENPVIIKLDPVPAQDAMYDGMRWFTYGIALITSVDKTEWDKLFELKRAELVWAADVKRKQQDEAATIYTQVMNSVRH